jgi:hypothetical protein
MKRVFAMGAASTIVVACSSAGQHSPPLPNEYGDSPIVGSGGTDGDAGAEGGAQNLGPAKAGVCPTAAMYDYDGDSGFKGTSAIAGTITFSTAVPAGHQIYLTLLQYEMGGGRSGYGTYPLSLPMDATSFTYRLSSISDHYWSIEVQVDMAGGPELTDPGDLMGLYAGTAAAPIHDSTAGIKLPTPPCYSGVDFGAGPL